MSRLARIAGFGALFFAFFVIGLILTFPMGLVSRVIEAQAEEALGFDYDVEIERVRFSGIVGVKLIGVTLESTSPLREGEVRLPTEIDAVRVRVNPLSLLSGTPSVRAVVQVDDGRIRVGYGGHEDGTAIDVDFEALEMSSLDIIRQSTGMPMQGALSGTVRLEYDDENRLAGGNIDLAIPQFIIGPGHIRNEEALRQVGGSIPIGAANLGPTAIRMPIDGSTVSVEEFSAAGSDIRIDATGRIELRDPMRASRVAVSMTLALDEGFVEANALGSPLGMVPVLQRAQTRDGYALMMSGLLGNLRLDVATGLR